MLIEAERRAGSFEPGEAEASLASVPELSSPFVRSPGREVPDWIAHLIPG
jgi:hypothetical protein